MDKKEYVLGFAFNEDNSKVALIRKNRPEWQKGLLNGIGGKVEPTDSSGMRSMEREFFEETGLNGLIWDYVGKMSSDDWIVYVYKSNYNDLSKIQSTTDEEVIVCNIYDIYLNKYDIIENIKWLIAMCATKDAINNKIFLNISYN